MATQAEWNFIFLIYADLTVSPTVRDSDSWKFELLKTTLSTITIPEYCNLFFIKNTIRLKSRTERVIEQDEFICEQSIQGTASSLYPKETVATMDEKPQKIGNYLIRIRQDFPSQKTILFTWDHGSIFGINKIATQSIVPLKSGFLRREIDVFPDFNFHVNPLVYRKVNSIVKSWFLEEMLPKTDDQSFFLSRILPSIDRKIFDENLELEANMLTNEMLAKSLELGNFKGENGIDIVCMMNCCMQNLHAQFALRNNVKFLIAPVTWIYFPGYDYNSIFLEINANPSICARELSRKIIDVCRRDAKLPYPVVEKIESQALFAIDPASTFEIAGLIRENILYEMDEVKKDKNYKYKFIPLVSDNPYIEFDELKFPDYRLIDLLEFFIYRTTGFFTSYPPTQIKISNEVCLKYQKSIQDKFIGIRVRRINKNEISGIVISLPTRKVYLDPNELFIKLYYKANPKYQSELVRYLGLDAFLSEVYNF